MDEGGRLDLFINSEKPKACGFASHSRPISHVQKILNPPKQTILLSRLAYDQGVLVAPRYDLGLVDGSCCNILGYIPPSATYYMFVKNII